MTSIEKLAFIGKRGMGALEFVPEIKRGSMTGQIDIKALADLAEKIALEREHVRILKPTPTKNSLPYAVSCICQRWIARNYIAVWYSTSLPIIPTTTTRTSRSSWIVKVHGGCHQPMI